MDLSVFYNKQKYLIQNLFRVKSSNHEVMIQIGEDRTKLPGNKSSSCFFFKQGDSKKFFKVTKLRNVLSDKKSQTIYQKISFNTQNSLVRKKVQCELEYPGKIYRKQSVDTKSLKVFSPLTGVIIKILKESGETRQDEVILVIDAMKMENKILAPKEGKISMAPLSPGQSIKTGELLFTIS